MTQIFHGKMCHRRMYEKEDLMQSFPKLVFSHLGELTIIFSQEGQYTVSLSYLHYKALKELALTGAVNYTKHQYFQIFCYKKLM